MATTINKKTLVTLKAAFAAFGVYFCMYGFRKPFTVASFEGLSYFGVDYPLVWETIKKRLPNVAEEIREILKGPSKL